MGHTFCFARALFAASILVVMAAAGCSGGGGAPGATGGAGGPVGPGDRGGSGGSGGPAAGGSSGTGGSDSGGPATGGRGGGGGDGGGGSGGGPGGRGGSGGSGDGGAGGRAGPGMDGGRPDVAADASRVPDGPADASFADAPGPARPDAGSAGPPTFGELYRTIFGVPMDMSASSCWGSTCHNPRGESIIDFSTRTLAYGTLVPLFVRLDSPENSTLVRRLRSDILTQRMPLGRPPLSAETVVRIESWIRAGARND